MVRLRRKEEASGFVALVSLARRSISCMSECEAIFTIKKYIRRLLTLDISISPTQYSFCITLCSRTSNLGQPLRCVDVIA